MTTTPADLLAAANRHLQTPKPWSGYVAYELDEFARQLCEYVKATINADDDEPVTVEWLLSIGFELRHDGYYGMGRDRWDHVVGIIFDKQGFQTLFIIEKHPVRHGSHDAPITRKQVRQLLTGLNIEIKHADGSAT